VFYGRFFLSGGIFVKRLMASKRRKGVSRRKKNWFDSRLDRSRMPDVPRDFSPATGERWVDPELAKEKEDVGIPF
jgi:hypothetical protein